MINDDDDDDDDAETTKVSVEIDQQRFRRINRQRRAGYRQWNSAEMGRLRRCRATPFHCRRLQLAFHKVQV